MDITCIFTVAGRKAAQKKRYIKLPFHHAILIKYLPEYGIKRQGMLRQGLGFWIKMQA